MKLMDCALLYRTQSNFFEREAYNRSIPTYIVNSGDEYLEESLAQGYIGQREEVGGKLTAEFLMQGFYNNPDATLLCVDHEVINIDDATDL